MGLTGKDVRATLFTTLVVLVFAATHQGWSVPLVEDSHRWAAGTIALLGIGACGSGSTRTGSGARLASVLGGIAGVLVVISLATGSLTALSLLAIDILVLWAVSTLRHLRG